MERYDPIVNTSLSSLKIIQSSISAATRTSPARCLEKPLDCLRCSAHLLLLSSASIALLLTIVALPYATAPDPTSVPNVNTIPNARVDEITYCNPPRGKHS
ncbi:uncharacterized protein SCHCODRAFT_02094478 [Schizophyllum commune H4-8]|uniref:uncharacterized protein n=1 Tax=Schizophyllum commune (strain H4-8 / FGSC 9210) TaxID=578458 RepID=UPI00215FDE04|nr:uncharacterized protein SCHCODRAFT_02094478 [Schizophyllum commune H4-8]KAI5886285.1 hypothetical protein SCHCODRAFT_02094478 [Schizophyllum commune H4-8]